MAPRRQQQTRGNSKSRPRATRARTPPTLSVDDFNEDEEEDDDEIAADHALALFLRRVPSGADHWVCMALTNHGDHIVQDRSAPEAKNRPVELANDTVAICSKWAAAEGKQTRFRCTWQAGDRVLASHQWTCGDGDPSALDGTVESFLAQQQRHAETNHRLHLEGFQLVAEAQKTLLASAMRRIEALERDNEMLRERLRKIGDIDADIAVQTVAAELEQKTRTVDILEHKVLPVVQAVLMQKLQQQMVAPAAAAAPANDAGAALPPTGGDATH